MTKLTDTPERNEYKLEATVKSVAQATEGYGENEHVVGVKVESSYVFEVDGDAVKRSLSFTLPLALRRFALPGDKITMVVGQTNELGDPKGDN